jgi:putative transposase
MSSPLRFFGADHPIDIDGVTIPPRCAVEVTFRTHRQEFLLRPDKETSELTMGCFGRAYHRYPDLNLHVLRVISNHGCFLATPETAATLSSFMRDFLSTLAVKLNGHRGRSGTFWERRYRAIPVVDEAALEDRFRYVLTQGTKENLVWSARDWPGASSIPALLGGPRLVGRWRDQTAEYEVRRQLERRRMRASAAGESEKLPAPPQIWREYPIDHVPLPHWRGLKPGQQRARVAAMLADDDRRTRERHARDGTRPLGVAALLAVDPFARPAEPDKSAAPLCHASTVARRRAFRVAYRRFVESIRTATLILGRSVSAAGFPPGSHTPPLRHEVGPRTCPPQPVPFVGPMLSAEPRSYATGPPAPS